MFPTIAAIRPYATISAIASRIAAAERSGETRVRVGSLDARRDFTDVRDVVQAYRARLEAWDPDLGARRRPATPPDPRLQRQLRELGYVDEAGAPAETQ